MDMLSAFPHIIPRNADLSHYSGFMNIKGQEYYLDIKLSKTRSSNKSLDGSTVSCEWKLKDLVRDYDKLLQQRLCQCSKLVDFLQEFKRIVELQLEKRGQTDCVTVDGQLYDSLVIEIEQIGWDRLSFVNQTFQELHFVTEDVKSRKHTLRMHLNDKHPVLAPVCSVDLPKALNVSWSQNSKLQDLLIQFEKQLTVYQDLWDNLDELDLNTWILEPEKPNRSDLDRRIALGNSASIQISVSPELPRMFPECRFLGPDHVINPLKTKLNTNLHKWNPTCSIFANLESVLDISFPAPTEANKQEYSVECGVCYSYRLGDEIPEETCDNSHCGRPFHHSCLNEWLRALPTCRQSFDVLFGDCPYCSTPITMKLNRTRNR